MIIRTVRPRDWDQWYAMRLALWPGACEPDDEQDMRNCLDGIGMTVFVAEAEDGQLVGLLEAGIRPYADGCDSRNVGYIEGWYVDTAYRRQGIGKALVAAAEAWARGQGCVEMGSDCLQDNEVSYEAHLALGYEEKERLIHFGKLL